MQKIVIINTRCANFSSVMMALKRLGCESVVSDDADTIRSADKLILPGVGTAAAGMENIEKYHLKELITETKKPLLGICLGMQLLSQMSSENAGTGSQEIGCLGVVPGTVSLLKAGGLRLPHMGWDQVDVIGDCPLFEGIPPTARSSPPASITATFSACSSIPRSQVPSAQGCCRTFWGCRT